MDLLGQIWEEREDGRGGGGMIKSPVFSLHFDAFLRVCQRHLIAAGPCPAWDLVKLIHLPMSRIICIESRDNCQVA